MTWISSSTARWTCASATTTTSIPGVGPKGPMGTSSPRMRSNNRQSSSTGPLSEPLIEGSLIMTCTVLLALVTLGSCNGLAGNDEMDRYFQRSETITLSAG